MSQLPGMSPIGMDAALQIAKDVVARKNQDGSVIVMKMNESSLFFKLDGISAAIWSELSHSRTASWLIERFSKDFPMCSSELATAVPALLERLVKLELLCPAPSASDAAAQVQLSAEQLRKYSFGELKEFDLAQIEAEILQESVYLDVFAGSDLRLKKNVSRITGALDKVQMVEGVTFEWDRDRFAGQQDADAVAHAGFIAQQVAEAMPEVVRRDAGTGYLAIEYSKVASYLVEAIKELNAKVQAQDNRIRELEAKYQR